MLIVLDISKNTGKRLDYYCPYCSKIISKNYNFCKYCGIKFRKKTNNTEAKEQLVGVKNIVILCIIVYYLTWISGIYISIDEALVSLERGLAYFIVYSIFFGGFLILSIIGLV